MTGWISNNPEASDLVCAMRSARVDSEVDTVRFDLERVKALLTNASLLPSYLQKRQNQPLYKRYHHLPLLLAVMVVALGLGSLLLLDNGLVSNNDPLVASSVQEFSTQRGQISNIALPSGATVQLAPLSRLVVSGDRITLEGEALFTVDHKTDKPFVVHSRNSVTRVLGTEFGVRSYPEDANVRIAVLEGRVAVNALVLSNGEVGLVHTSGATGYDGSDATVSSLLSWTKGFLSFENTQLSEVAVQLSRWYDVDFVLEDPSVGKLLLTTTVRSSDAVETIMKVISVSTQTLLERQGRTVLIKKSSQPVQTIEFRSPSMHADASKVPTNTSDPKVY